ncbi:XRE family transcriptional regulator [Amphritea sp. 2_MG-2023]|uniref:helix-turn-helix domain-containing protein n=1 Tax=Amphritea TaxID=515417 RepID=UPI001C0735A5|nr:MULTISPECIES: XRE family transcriptional regulator [Amphritea]MBU2967320.1 XRE family transcriptional regulator [Amphritea atlantica]MDO6420468.1 XRE family transcriptional regulator [Amphritea sp. 2_MG-2023]
MENIRDKGTIIAEQERVKFGQELRTRRKANNWTLEDLHKLCGVSIAAISKIEKGQSSPSFETILKITRSLQVNFIEMLDGSPLIPAASSRLIATHLDDIELFKTKFYDYHVHSSTLKHKAMVPLQMTIHTKEAPPRNEWSRHDGEEFIFVLKGELEFHTEHYKPIKLRMGESCYLDSTSPHAFVSIGDVPAEIISVCLSIEPLIANKSV